MHLKDVSVGTIKGLGMINKSLTDNHCLRSSPATARHNDSHCPMGPLTNALYYEFYSYAVLGTGDPSESGRWVTEPMIVGYGSVRDDVISPHKL